MSIELNQGNMYANGSVVVFPDGSKKLGRTKLKITARNGDEFYTVKQGDRLEQLAWLKWKRKVQNAQSYWWVIMDANPSIKNPLDLSAFIGKEILIPDIVRIKLEYDI